MTFRRSLYVSLRTIWRCRCLPLCAPRFAENSSCCVCACTRYMFNFFFWQYRFKRTGIWRLAMKYDLCFSGVEPQTNSVVCWPWPSGVTLLFSTFITFPIRERETTVEVISVPIRPKMIFFGSSPIGFRPVTYTLWERDQSLARSYIPECYKPACLFFVSVHSFVTNNQTVRTKHTWNPCMATRAAIRELLGTKKGVPS